MFIYLSKKIAIPNGIRLRSLSWNSEQGWIACGGDDGLLKVLKLESQTSKDPKSKGLAAPSNLSMNQTLEGHNGAVQVVTWNENYRKLTTSDQKGLIIVWMLYKGMWYEEMINNRNKSVVRDMCWTPDGQKICIVYEDGAVIVGSVDGNRLWGKEVKMQLTHVAWSPDSRLLLFGTGNSEVHVYDNMGAMITKLPLFCLEDSAGTTKLIGLDWYDGSEGLVDPNAPTLVVGFENGRLQIMRSDSDEKPVLIDTGMKVQRLCWNRSGSVLAVAGVSSATSTGGDEREISSIQFYTPFGQHLRTLRVPGGGISALSWEGTGLRIALAVDSFIYFANIRPDYKWAYFGKTLVYAFTKPDRADYCVIFWDTKSDERYTKYVKKLVSIRAFGEHCILVTKSDDASQQHILILCNAIGTPLDSKYIEIEPMSIAMTDYHIIVSSNEVVYIWQYRTPIAKIAGLEIQMSAAAMKRRDTKEIMFHIDSDPSVDISPAEYRKPAQSTNDAICCVAASESCCVIGRESGTVHRYSIPSWKLENKFLLRCRPQALALNCDNTRMSIIDISGVLTFFDMETKSKDGKSTIGEHLSFERKDAWDMKWSDDNPELFAMMEKTRMYIFRNQDPEEPILSSGYICSFSKLKIKAVLLDEIMTNPENPEKEFVIPFETKSLRDTKELLANVGLQDAFSFIDDRPHPRLWKLLAESALDKLDFGMAEKAFVRSAEYQGIQLVKRLKILDDKMKQKAEVCTYFRRFDEAESIYREMDRKDLAIDLRMRLGDWFRVVQLLQTGGGDDSLLKRAWNEIGEYYADRQKWSQAVQYFSQAKNVDMLKDCYYYLEDYVSLERLINPLPDGHPSLGAIGERFVSVGLSEHAVTAFVKAGDVKAAIDCCVLLNRWDRAVELAESHNFQQIETLLSKYATHLLDEKKTISAIELYRKANHHADAAKLLAQMAKDVGKSKVQPLRAKKMFVLSALEVDQHRKRFSDPTGNSGMTSAQQTLAGLLGEDHGGKLDKSLDNPWKGAEAYHYFLLAQRQLYDGYMDASMKTALRLRDYEDILSAREIYSLIAITAYYNKYYAQCSKAFIKLESLPDITPQEREAYQDLALNIFIRHPPQDPSNTKKYDCPSCKTALKEWMSSCSDCGTPIAGCISTGRSLFDTRGTAQCRTCKHRSFEPDIRGRQSCPLCHGRL